MSAIVQETRAHVRSLVARAYDAAGGRLPDSLAEEEFVAVEGVALSNAHPTPSECCERIHSRCVMDAVNEALDILSAPRPPPRTASPLAAPRGVERAAAPEMRAKARSCIFMAVMVCSVPFFRERGFC